MSFTNLSYDDCSYKANLQGNVSQLSYILDPVRYYNQNKCRPEVGIVGGTAVSHVNANLVDLESNLFGIDREASRCSAMKYVPNVEQAEGANHYRQTCTPKLDTSMKHLPACQINNVIGTPHPPPMAPFSCPK